MAGKAAPKLRLGPETAVDGQSQHRSEAVHRPGTRLQEPKKALAFLRDAEALYKAASASTTTADTCAPPCPHPPPRGEPLPKTHRPHGAAPRSARQPGAAAHADALLPRPDPRETRRRRRLGAVLRHVPPAAARGRRGGRPRLVAAEHGPAGDVLHEPGGLRHRGVLPRRRLRPCAAPALALCCAPAPPAPSRPPSPGLCLRAPRRAPRAVPPPESDPDNEVEANLQIGFVKVAMSRRAPPRRAPRSHKHCFSPFVAALASQRGVLSCGLHVERRGALCARAMSAGCARR